MSVTGTLHGRFTKPSRSKFTIRKLFGKVAICDAQRFMKPGLDGNPSDWIAWQYIFCSFPIAA